MKIEGTWEEKRCYIYYGDKHKRCHKQASSSGIGALDHALASGGLGLFGAIGHVWNLALATGFSSAVVFFFFVTVGKPPSGAGYTPQVTISMQSMNLQLFDPSVVWKEILSAELLDEIFVLVEMEMLEGSM